MEMYRLDLQPDTEELWIAPKRTLGARAKVSEASRDRDKHLPASPSINKKSIAITASWARRKSLSLFHWSELTKLNFVIRNFDIGLMRWPQ